MATMNVSLPDPMKEWVESRTATGRYSNASDYVRDLIRQDQERQSRIAHMQDLVTQARASGTGTMSMDDILAEAHRRAARS